MESRKESWADCVMVCLCVFTSSACSLLFEAGDDNGTECRELSFQQGTDGYDGAIDTSIWQSMPERSDLFEKTVIWDQCADHTVCSDDGPSTEILVLLRFDEIYGDSADQIPAHMQIVEASLHLNIVEGSGSRSGSVFAADVDWGPASTWESLMPGVLGELVSPAPREEGAASLDVQVTFQERDQNSFYGWVFRGTIDGVRIHSSEADMPSLRPRLTVLACP